MLVQATRRQESDVVGDDLEFAAERADVVGEDELGWTASGRSRTSRVHDLRHRFVVRRI
ncbi:MAG: hypothetical protein M0030_24225 [Actinomycetota bacterium]|nr:hypothetical protein [Actinomycetota bacterium]